MTISRSNDHIEALDRVSEAIMDVADAIRSLGLTRDENPGPLEAIAMAVGFKKEYGILMPGAGLDGIAEAVDRLADRLTDRRP